MSSEFTEIWPGVVTFEGEPGAVRLRRRGCRHPGRSGADASAAAHPPGPAARPDAVTSRKNARRRRSRFGNDCHLRSALRWDWDSFSITVSGSRPPVPRSCQHPQHRTRRIQMSSPVARRTARPRRYTFAAGGILVAALAATSACSTGGKSSADDKAGAATGGSGGGKVVQVVAAENFWGSIAGQIGGSHARVTSIITNPATDPHDYEPTATDARTVATADYAIVNGIGYDSWASKLLASNPSPRRSILTVGDLVGVKDGGNPHRWYSPADVHKVIERIAADYTKADPADAAYFTARKTTFETKTLGEYNSLISDIKAKYAGTPIGASESIVSPLADGLGLKMLTPYSFLSAISEGSDPTAQDKSTIDHQIATKQIKVYVYNSQNATPDVQAQVKAAKSAGIPVATVTETLSPAGVSFQQWQVTELKGIQQALAKATGK
jgi:zinc/manganese transport system substrate-binding protein